MAILAAAALLGAGCGDDSPGSPTPTDGYIDYPGDAASLQAALAMASAGDTIRVGAGTHLVDTTAVAGAEHAGLTIVGRTEAEAAAGTAERSILEFMTPGFRDGIHVGVGATNVTVRGLLIRGRTLNAVNLQAPGGEVVDCRIEDASQNSVLCGGPSGETTICENVLVRPGYFGVQALSGSRPNVIGNTIVAAGDCGIYNSAKELDCTRNIIVDSANWGIFCSGFSSAVLSCNTFFNNTTGHYSAGCDSGDGDFVADPLFCGDTYLLFDNSPCAEGNSECGQIGAMGVGCAARSKRN